MGQINALLSDLKKYQDIGLNAIAREKLKEVSDQLLLDADVFHQFATAIRHEGLEAGVYNAVDGFVLALAQDLSEQQLVESRVEEMRDKNQQEPRVTENKKSHHQRRRRR